MNAAPIGKAHGRLTLAVNATGWTVDYQDTDQADAYRALFGGTIIPLPFTMRARPVTVIAHVARIEPETVIHLEGEEV